ncbi:hypothetical protein JCM10213_003629 [Rhodosporidiobolus nylandii]
MSVLRLTDWFCSVQPLALPGEGYGVEVVGLLEGGGEGRQHPLSLTVGRRIDNRTFTCGPEGAARTVKLVGELDEVRAKLAGVSQLYIDTFRSGIPEQYALLLAAAPTNPAPSLNIAAAFPPIPCTSAEPYRAPSPAPLELDRPLPDSLFDLGTGYRRPLGSPRTKRELAQEIRRARQRKAKGKERAVEQDEEEPLPGSRMVDRDEEYDEEAAEEDPLWQREAKWDDVKMADGGLPVAPQEKPPEEEEVDAGGGRPPQQTPLVLDPPPPRATPGPSPTTAEGAAPSPGIPRLPRLHGALAISGRPISTKAAIFSTIKGFFSLSPACRRSAFLQILPRSTLYRDARPTPSSTRDVLLTWQEKSLGTAAGTPRVPSPASDMAKVQEVPQPDEGPSALSALREEAGEQQTARATSEEPVAQTADVQMETGEAEVEAEPGMKEAGFGTKVEKVELEVMEEKLETNGDLHTTFEGDAMRDDGEGYEAANNAAEDCPQLSPGRPASLALPHPTVASSDRHSSVDPPLPSSQSQVGSFASLYHSDSEEDGNDSADLTARDISAFLERDLASSVIDEEEYRAERRATAALEVDVGDLPEEQVLEPQAPAAEVIEPQAGTFTVVAAEAEVIERLSPLPLAPLEPEGGLKGVLPAPAETREGMPLSLEAAATLARPLEEKEMPLARKRDEVSLAQKSDKLEEVMHGPADRAEALSSSLVPEGAAPPPAEQADCSITKDAGPLHAAALPEEAAAEEAGNVAEEMAIEVPVRKEDALEGIGAAGDGLARPCAASHAASPLELAVVPPDASPNSPTVACSPLDPGAPVALPAAPLSPISPPIASCAPLPGPRPASPVSAPVLQPVPAPVPPPPHEHLFERTRRADPLHLSSHTRTRRTPKPARDLLLPRSDGFPFSHLSSRLHDAVPSPDLTGQSVEAGLARPPYPYIRHGDLCVAPSSLAQSSAHEPQQRAAYPSQLGCNLLPTLGSEAAEPTILGPAGATLGSAQPPREEENGDHRDSTPAAYETAPSASPSEVEAGEPQNPEVPCADAEDEQPPTAAVLDDAGVRGVVEDVAAEAAGELISQTVGGIVEQVAGDAVGEAAGEVVAQATAELAGGMVSDALTAILGGVTSAAGRLFPVNELPPDEPAREATCARTALEAEPAPTSVREDEASTERERASRELQRQIEEQEEQWRLEAEERKKEQMALAREVFGSSSGRNHPASGSVKKEKKPPITRRSAALGPLGFLAPPPALPVASAELTAQDALSALRNEPAPARAVISSFYAKPAGAPSPAQSVAGSTAKPAPRPPNERRASTAASAASPTRSNRSGRRSPSRPAGSAGQLNQSGEATAQKSGATPRRRRSQFVGVEIPVAAKKETPKKRTTRNSTAAGRSSPPLDPGDVEAKHGEDPERVTAKNVAAVTLEAEATAKEAPGAPVEAEPPARLAKKPAAPKGKKSSTQRAKKRIAPTVKKGSLSPRGSPSSSPAAPDLPAAFVPAAAPAPQPAVEAAVEAAVEPDPSPPAERELTPAGEASLLALPTLSRSLSPIPSLPVLLTADPAVVFPHTGLPAQSPPNPPAQAEEAPDDAPGLSGDHGALAEAEDEPAWLVSPAKGSRPRPRGYGSRASASPAKKAKAPQQRGASSESDDPLADPLPARGNKRLREPSDEVDDQERPKRGRRRSSSGRAARMILPQEQEKYRAAEPEQEQQQDEQRQDEQRQDEQRQDEQRQDVSDSAMNHAPQFADDFGQQEYGGGFEQDEDLSLPEGGEEDDEEPVVAHRRSRAKGKGKAVVPNDEDVGDAEDELAPRPSPASARKRRAASPSATTSSKKPRQDLKPPRPPSLAGKDPRPTGSAPSQAKPASNASRRSRASLPPSLALPAPPATPANAGTKRRQRSSDVSAAETPASSRPQRARKSTADWWKIDRGLEAAEAGKSVRKRERSATLERDDGESQAEEVEEPEESKPSARKDGRKKVAPRVSATPQPQPVPEIEEEDAPEEHGDVQDTSFDPDTSFEQSVDGGNGEAHSPSKPAARYNKDGKRRKKPKPLGLPRNKHRGKSASPVKAARTSSASIAGSPAKQHLAHTSDSKLAKKDAAAKEKRRAKSHSAGPALVEADEGDGGSRAAVPGWAKGDDWRGLSEVRIPREAKEDSHRFSD